MAEQNTTAVDSAAVRERASAAFSTLGNETRLGILLALWEAYDYHDESSTLAFSELQEQVGVRDSGQFNYHLERLVGDFIRKRESGYEITEAGKPRR